MINRMAVLAAVSMTLGGCSSPCEDAGYVCVEVLDADVQLAGSNVERIVIAAELGGYFVPGGPIELAGSDIVRAETTPGGGTSYNRTPLKLGIADGDGVYDGPGDVVHLVDRGTDGAALVELCGQEVIAEVTLGAPYDPNPGNSHTFSTTWLEGVYLDCR